MGINSHSITHTQLYGEIKFLTKVARARIKKSYCANVNQIKHIDTDHTFYSQEEEEKSITFPS